MAWNTYKQHLAGTGEKTLKKYLYTIRPLLCIQYMKTYEAFPPVLFDQLLGASDLTAEWVSTMTDLLDIKKRHPEQKKAPEYIERFFTDWVLKTLEVLDHEFINRELPHREAELDALNSIYRSVIA